MIGRPNHLFVIMALVRTLQTLFRHPQASVLSLHKVLSVERSLAISSIMASKEDNAQRSTLNNKEANKFSEVFSYDVWWNSEIGATLRAMNDIRVPLVRDSLIKKQKATAKPLEGFKILDIGSGGGLLAEPLARLGANVTGLDPVESNIMISNRHLEECSPDLANNLTYECATIEEFVVNSENVERFDCITVSEVLEHVDNVEFFLERARKALKPNGKLVITTINQTMAAYLFIIIAAENIFGLVPKGTHHYKMLVPLKGLKLMLQDLGFNLDLVHGSAYNAITKKWFWVPTTQVNYALVATKRA